MRGHDEEIDKDSIGGLIRNFLSTAISQLFFVNTHRSYWVRMRANKQVAALISG
jgi:hypothetical protein